MVFSSLSFISVFLPLVFLLSLGIRRVGGKNVLLIVASLVFYSYGEPIYVLLMIGSCLVNWLFALLVAKKEASTGASGGDISGAGARPGTTGDQNSAARWSRRAWLVAAVAVNLGLLGVFKYAAMAVGTVNGLFGLHMAIPVIELPIGISFYTFQALSYVIDTYRGEVTAAHNPLHVMLYISFFPQLIAGPIVRYRDIHEQIRQRTVTAEEVGLGLRRFIVGLSKKVIIADTLAVVVDRIYAAPCGEIDAAAAWLAAVAYALQIYFDFSGYSDMAIGMARMFGFQFKENFRYPYAADTIQNFWRRWHVSLSTWFREYLYIPLGGNRKGKPRTILNKLIVFFLCGLWHGAAWTFVVWGLAHGFFLLLEEVLPIKKMPRPLRHAYTLLVVVCTFVIFRSETFGQALAMLGKMFGFSGGVTAGRPGALALSLLDPFTVAILLVAIVAMLPVTLLLQPRARRTSYAPAVIAPSLLSYVGALLLLVCCVLLLAAGGYHPFIYFRF